MPTRTKQRQARQRQAKQHQTRQHQTRQHQTKQQSRYDGGTKATAWVAIIALVIMTAPVILALFL